VRSRGRQVRVTFLIKKRIRVFALPVFFNVETIITFKIIIVSVVARLRERAKAVWGRFVVKYTCNNLCCACVLCSTYLPTGVFRERSVFVSDLGFNYFNVMLICKYLSTKYDSTTSYVPRAVGCVSNIIRATEWNRVLTKHTCEYSFSEIKIENIIAKYGLVKSNNARALAVEDSLKRNNARRYHKLLRFPYSRRDFEFEQTC